MTAWADILPMHIPAVQVLDRLVRCGWPKTAAPEGLMGEARNFLPDLVGNDPKAAARRDFLATEMAQDHEGILARLSFLRSACRDVALFGDLIFADPDAFMAQSETFSLFNYHLARDLSEGAIEATRPWVAYVSNLTRTEAPFLVPLITVAEGAQVLEPGGNSGVFARALIDTFHPLQYVVMDLPAVCALGRDRGAVPGLSFVAADMRKGDWRTAAGFAPDVILFKSVLHDWPEAEAGNLLTEALRALAPGGQIVIAERTAFRGMTGGTSMDYANLVFAAFYRDPDLYQAMLQRLAPDLAVTVSRTVIDTEWFVLTARRTS
jgi:hypothetical protein